MRRCFERVVVATCAFVTDRLIKSCNSQGGMLPVQQQASRRLKRQQSGRIAISTFRLRWFTEFSNLFNTRPTRLVAVACLRVPNEPKECRNTSIRSHSLCGKRTFLSFLQFFPCSDFLKVTPKRSVSWFTRMLNTSTVVHSLQAVSACTWKFCSIVRHSWPFENWKSVRDFRGEFLSQKAWCEWDYCDMKKS